MKYALEVVCNKRRKVCEKMFNSADEAWEHARACHMSASSVFEGTEEEIKALLGKVTEGCLQRGFCDISDFIDIGTKRVQRCYDGKMHETTMKDYLVKLYGNTYTNRSLLRNMDFHFTEGDATPYWYKNVESKEEVTQIESEVSSLGIKVFVKPIFRITDTETNPIAR